MNALLYPLQVQKTFSHIATIRCEVENYFNVDIRKCQRVKKKISKGYNIKADGLKHIRGNARKYFCYLSKIYLGLSNEEIGKYIDIDEHTVGMHYNSLTEYLTEKEEDILNTLSFRINGIFLMQYKIYRTGG